MKWALLLVAACGRLDFDPRSNAVDGAPSDPSLVAWYPMDDLPGRDASGNHRDAVCDPTCPAPTAGVRDGALQFDHTCLVLPADPAFDLQMGTVAAWFRVDAVPGPYQMVIARAYGPSASDSIETFVDSDSIVVFHQDAVDNHVLSAPQALGVWTHLAVTFDATQAQLFLDGVSRASTPWQVAYDAHAWRMGCDFDLGAEAAFLPGALDDVRFYDRELSATEIAALAAP